MKLRVDLTWGGGIVEEGDRSPPPEPVYDLYDADTGRALVDHWFDNCVDLEAYIAQHYPGCERSSLPPAPPEEAARVVRLLALVEAPDASRNLDLRYFRSALCGQLYQWGHPPETVARLRRALGLTVS